MSFFHFFALALLPISVVTLAIISLTSVWQTVETYGFEQDRYLKYDSNNGSVFDILIIVTGAIAAGLDVIYLITLSIVFFFKKNINVFFYSMMITFPLCVFLLSSASFLLGLGLKTQYCNISCQNIKMFGESSSQGKGFVLMCVCSVASLLFFIINSFAFKKFYKSIKGDVKKEDIVSNKNQKELKQLPTQTTQPQPIAVSEANSDLVSTEKLQNDLNHAINILQNIQVQMPALIEQQQQKNHNIYQTQQLINLLLQQQIQQITVPQLNNHLQQIQQPQLLQLQQQIDLLKQQNNNNLSTSPQTSATVIPTSNVLPQNPPPPYSKEPEVAINTDEKENLSIPETRKEEKENERIKSLKIELESQLQNFEEDNDSEKDNLENITIEIKKED